ncbi:MAG: hypothetical protein QOD00_2594 [Blastocatellia bacterium]|jgi:hypothetical protein|nr:hypothetical protein [Blastocatellia bacterium]
MKALSCSIRMLALIVLILAFSTLAQAQIQMLARTWLSATGSDSNPCTRTAPCRFLSKGFATTAAGGELDILDPGDYGSVTLTRSITIDGKGNVAAGMTINVMAQVYDVVVIRNISLNGNYQASTGVFYSSGGRLTLENVNIDHYSNSLISVSGSPVQQNLVVLNVTGSNSGNGAGIFIDSSSASTLVDVLIDNSNFHNVPTGIDVRSNARVLIRNTTIKGYRNLAPTPIGVNIEPANGATSQVSLENCGIMGTNIAVRANGANGNALAALSNNHISNNTTGVAVLNSTVYTFLNNELSFNGADVTGGSLTPKNPN